MINRRVELLTKSVYDPVNTIIRKLDGLLSAPVSVGRVI